jgi:hypothetical protein
LEVAGSTWLRTGECALQKLWTKEYKHLPLPDSLLPRTRDQSPDEFERSRDMTIGSDSDEDELADEM